MTERSTSQPAAARTDRPTKGAAGLADRYSTWIAAVLLAGFLAAVWTAAWKKSETIDEGLFIGGGTVQFQQVNPNFDLSHPPLLRWLAGVSATVIGGARLPADVPLVPNEAMELRTYRLQETFNWTQRFFYEPPHDHRRVLFWGRFGFAFIGALAGWLVFREVRRRWGALPGLAALAAFLATPEVLAHAQWAHSDLGAATSLVLLSLALARAQSAPTWKHDTWLAVALAGAILVKLTAILLVPLVVVWIAWQPGTPPGRSPGKFTLMRLGRIALVGWMVLIVGYFPQPRVLPPHEFLMSDVAHMLGGASQDALLTRTAAGALRYAPLPDSLLKGIVYTSLLGGTGQVSFLHGEVGTQGWWYYFPLAVVLKYPTPLLLLATWGVVAFVRSRSVSPTFKLAWTLPPVVVFAAAMSQHINIGVRSVLPIAPYLALMVGAAVTSAATLLSRLGAGLLLATSVLSGAAAWPYFLGYFNPLFGGRSAAHRWLADSNLDWGQDLPALKETLERRGIEQIHLAYWGAALPERWDIHSIAATGPTEGWYAISSNLVIGLWDPKDSYAWVRERTPTEIVGSSLLLYSVPRRVGPAVPEATAEHMARGLELLYEKGRAYDAIPIFEEILAREPTHYGAQYQLAKALELSGETARAVVAWRRFMNSAKRGDHTKDAEEAHYHVQTLDHWLRTGRIPNLASLDGGADAPPSLLTDAAAPQDQP